MAFFQVEEVVPVDCEVAGVAVEFIKFELAKGKKLVM